MKKALFLNVFILLFIFEANSQVIDFGEFEKASITKEGFQKFKEFIGDTRIVIIGEQEHGVGTHYENFNLLAQFFHEEMGFDIIIQEYCFFEFYQVNDSLSKGKSAQKFRDGMYWPQAKSLEYDGFFNYLDREAKGNNPIQMLGADPRVFTRDKFIDYLKEEVKSNSIEIKNSHRFFKVLATLFKMEYSDSLSTKEEKEFFFKSCIAITKQYQNDREVSNRWKERFIKNLEVFAKNAWGVDGYKIDNPDRFFQREKGMAENIIWLAKTQFPNKKILIHLHNGHMAKNTHLLKGHFHSSQVKALPNVGSMLHKEFGDNCLHLATSFYSGSYCKWDYKMKEIPKPSANSLETQIHKQGIEYGFRPFENSSTQEENMFYCDFNIWMKIKNPIIPVNQLFDGLIFIDKVKTPTEKK